MEENLLELFCLIAATTFSRSVIAIHISFIHYFDLYNYICTGNYCENQRNFCFYWQRGLINIEYEEPLLLFPLFIIYLEVLESRAFYKLSSRENVKYLIVALYHEIYRVTLFGTDSAFFFLFVCYECKIANTTICLPKPIVISCRYFLLACCIMTSRNMLYLLTCKED